MVYLRTYKHFISSPDPITSPAILTPSPVLPPSLLFDPRYFFVLEELLPPKKQIHSPSSSSTTLSNSSQNQTCDLVSPSLSVYTPTPPQVFEIGKCSDKMYLKHHEKQVEDILNYLDELSFHRIEKMEEGRINDNELKTELKRIRTQIIKLQKERMPPKRTSTSETPAITLDALRQLIADFTTALEAQAAAMANADNPNRNTGPRNLLFRKRGGKLQRKNSINSSTLDGSHQLAQRLMDQIIKRDSVLETNDRKRKLEDERNIINNNYQNNHNNNNRNNDYHRQQNRRQETFRTYTATNGYAGNLPLCKDVDYIHSGTCSVKCRVSGLQQDRSPDQVLQKQQGHKKAYLEMSFYLENTTLEDIQLSSEFSSI
ncbi:hypothetical protein Tco_0226410 [Tanacetum coccineum]